MSPEEIADLLDPGPPVAHEPWAPYGHVNRFLRHVASNGEVLDPSDESATARRRAKTPKGSKARLGAHHRIAAGAVV
jgi:hypothetical protein